ncbi:histidine phosphatase family protein [Trinickia dinghuensis]|uniref:Alpha-ribazole phosphatase n=1 Tax=Trinickia dinghuensis TaxID=2291023 RepID=A0A3D8JVG7_9BURK|nr:histidine phosphatase family protein [Trinickia dinghuensis]RDU96594.1 alpha-ribazole phosphatase [Trinickia dinghuensis]
MDLVLIRHPTPAIDAGVCYGKTDVPLAVDAAASARLLAARLAALDVPPPEHFATSPLRRCADVAHPLARHFGCACAVDVRLQEIDFGTWEGQRWDAIDRAALDAWAADLRHARMHGGESVAQFEARVGAWLELWREAEGAAGSSVLAVTHAGVMRTIAALVLDEAIETTLKWPLEMAAVVWLRRGAPGGEWRLLRWNV